MHYITTTTNLKKCIFILRMNTSLLHQLSFWGINTIFWIKITLLFFIVFFCDFMGFSQTLISQIEVKGFKRNEYKAGTQNWNIKQDANKRLYIANNEGLLVYDGTNWSLYPVPNKTILRSIDFDTKGKLFVGAQDELGYFAPDKVGRLCFTSLKNLLPIKDRSFTDVWQLEVNGKDVFFRTDMKIFKFDGQKMKVYPAKSSWLSLYKHEGKILAQDKELGLLIYQNNVWKPFISKEKLPDNFLITDLIPYQKGRSLLSTVNHGLFLLRNDKLTAFHLNSDKINPKQHFTSLTILNTGDLLIGTYFNGIYRVSKKRKVLENISSRNGMPNNTVRCVFADSKNNVWAGLDNGLAFFTYNNTLKLINPPAFNNGAGYGVEMFKNDLYFALSTGLLWYRPHSASDLSVLTEEPKTVIEGLTWNLSLINNQLLAGRDDGLFAIQNKKANPIIQSTGYWTCRAIQEKEKLKIIAGNYLGVRFFEMNLKKFEDKGVLEKFKESSRYIEANSNSIWVSHPYQGVYNIRLSDKSIKLFSGKEGLPTDLNNHVFKIKGSIVFATPKGIYEYDSVNDTIFKSKTYAKIFGEKPIRYLKEDDKGNIWFVQEKMLGVVDFSSRKPKMHYIPELNNKIVSGFENIFPYDNHNILIGGEAGFYHLNYKKYIENIKPFSVYVSQVKTSGIIDSVLFGGYTLQKDKIVKKIKIPYQLNSLRFAYTASIYQQSNDLEYSYYLEGFDMNWSIWSNNTEKEYTNLPAGTYTFKVKARKSPSHESSVYEFTFTILPPWYQTIWAYALYFILLASSLFILLKYQERIQRKKEEAKRLADLQEFQEEQEQQTYQHKLELAESEKETVRLRNEKLNDEIKHKNAELASSTMHLVQKKELIVKLKKELQQIQKNSQVETNKKELKKLIKTLSEEAKLDDEWENFSKHFNNVHGDFLSILKKKFPNLSPHNLRLCAYLRMNLSSKEIAPLMGISIRGVEVNRYRLRKKLDLSTEVNLIEYLLSIEKESI